MATTIEKISEYLDELELKHRVVEGMDMIALGFGSSPESSTYRDHEGDPFIHVFLQVGERGEHFVALSPRCWPLPDATTEADKLNAVFETLLRIQSRNKIIRFDLIEDCIFPNIEIPIEDSEFTKRQLKRVISTLLYSIRSCNDAIRHAIDTGNVLIKEDDEEDHDEGGIDDGIDDGIDEVAIDGESGGDAAGAGGNIPSARTSGDVMSLQDLVDEAGGLDGGAIETLRNLLGGQEDTTDES